MTKKKITSPTVSATPAIASSENIEQTLQQLEQEWVDVTLKGDAAGVEHIVADDWVGTSWEGKRQSRVQIIEELKSGKYKADSMTLDAVRVRPFGDVAIVTLNQTEKADTKEKIPAAFTHTRMSGRKGTVVGRLSQRMEVASTKPSPDQPVAYAHGGDASQGAADRRAARRGYGFSQIDSRAARG